MKNVGRIIGVLLFVGGVLMCVLDEYSDSVSLGIYSGWSLILGLLIISVFFDRTTNQSKNAEKAKRERKQKVEQEMPVIETREKKTEPSHRFFKPFERYMGEYDVGEIKKFADCTEKPKCVEEGTYNNLKWARFEDKIIIFGLKHKTSLPIIIPETINGYVVAGIEGMAFMNCGIPSIVIPETVEFIGGLAIGFVREPVFSYEMEQRIKAQAPFAENHPTSVFMDKEYFFHCNPKTTIIGKESTIAQEYALKHCLPFIADESNPIV